MIASTELTNFYYSVLVKLPFETKGINSNAAKELRVKFLEHGVDSGYELYKLNLHFTFYFTLIPLVSDDISKEKTLS